MLGRAGGAARAATIARRRARVGSCVTYAELLQRLVGAAALRRCGRGSTSVRGAAWRRSAIRERSLRGRPRRRDQRQGLDGGDDRGGLRAAGVRVGLYTSPHLLRFTERIAIDGAEIERERAAALARARARARREASATFFEVATAMAFVAFAEARVDVAVLEVGLGGRLDATNVVERPLVRGRDVGRARSHRRARRDAGGDRAREGGHLEARRAGAVTPAHDEAAAAVLQAEAERVGRDADRAASGATSTTPGCRRWRSPARTSDGTRRWRGARSESSASASGDRRRARATCMAGAARAAVADGAGRRRAQRRGRARAGGGVARRATGRWWSASSPTRMRARSWSRWSARAARVIVTAPPSPRALPAAELAQAGAGRDGGAGSRGGAGDGGGRARSSWPDRSSSSARRGALVLGEAADADRRAGPGRRQKL